MSYHISPFARVQADGVGQGYLIEHSTGSDKSNSITWVAHQLVELEHGDKSVLHWRMKMVSWNRSPPNGEVESPSRSLMI